MSGFPCKFYCRSHLYDLYLTLFFSCSITVFPPHPTKQKKPNIPLVVTDCTFKAQTCQSSAFPVSYLNSWHTQSSFYETGRFRLSTSFDAGEMLSGKTTSNSIIKSPRWSGFLGNGKPYPIILLLIPGLTTSFTVMGMVLPSIVGTLIELPHKA